VKVGGERSDHVLRLLSLPSNLVLQILLCKAGSPEQILEWYQAVFREASLLLLYMCAPNCEFRLRPSEKKLQILTCLRDIFGAEVHYQFLAWNCHYDGNAKGASTANALSQVFGGLQVLGSHRASWA